MSTPQDSFDPTLEVGSETDVSPLGRPPQKPAHEQTADEDRDTADWDGIAALPEFRALLKRKLRFIVPATIFFLVYYFTLPVLVAWAPELMERRLGPVNLAYAFALSQFFMAWGVAACYVRVAARWDKAAEEILSKGGH